MAISPGGCKERTAARSSSGKGACASLIDVLGEGKTGRLADGGKEGIALSPGARAVESVSRVNMIGTWRGADTLKAERVALGMPTGCVGRGGLLLKAERVALGMPTGCVRRGGLLRGCKKYKDVLSLTTEPNQPCGAACSTTARHRRLGCTPRTHGTDRDSIVQVSHECNGV